MVNFMVKTYGYQYLMVFNHEIAVYWFVTCELTSNLVNFLAHFPEKNVFGWEWHLISDMPRYAKGSPYIPFVVFPSTWHSKKSSTCHQGYLEKLKNGLWGKECGFGTITGSVLPCFPPHTVENFTGVKGNIFPMLIAFPSLKPLEQPNSNPPWRIENQVSGHRYGK